MVKKILFVGTLAVIGFLANCTTHPPENIDNICAIFEERPDWYSDAKESEKRWGTPVYVQMAIIRQESSFQHDARPNRTQLLGFIPWTRPSSALGYAQALDSTWNLYKRQTGKGFASRSDFADAIDFVGWYTNQSNQHCRISKWDAELQYLAYHEGQAGFNRRTYMKKNWLRQTARRVGARAKLYNSQLKQCEQRIIKNQSWLHLF